MFGLCSVTAPVLDFERIDFPEWTVPGVAACQMDAAGETFESIETSGRHKLLAELSGGAAPVT
jgi:hypothetical protein